MHFRSDECFMVCWNLNRLFWKFCLELASFYWATVYVMAGRKMAILVGTLSLRVVAVLKCIFSIVKSVNFPFWMWNQEGCNLLLQKYSPLLYVVQSSVNSHQPGSSGISVALHPQCSILWASSSSSLASKRLLIAEEAQPQKRVEKF